MRARICGAAIFSIIYGVFYWALAALISTSRRMYWGVTSTFGMIGTSGLTFLLVESKLYSPTKN